MVMPLRPSTARQPSRSSRRKKFALAALCVGTLVLAVIVRFAFNADVNGVSPMAAVEPASEPRPEELQPARREAVPTPVTSLDSEQLEALAAQLREQYGDVEVDVEVQLADSGIVPAYDADGNPMYDGRPLKPVGTLSMTVTAYSPDARSCGIFADGITASGYPVRFNDMKLVAADTKLLPFGTLVSIPGYADDRPVPVLDRGGKIKGHRLDLLYPTHEAALQWGRQTLTVTLWDYADESD